MYKCPKAFIDKHMIYVYFGIESKKKISLKIQNFVFVLLPAVIQEAQKMV